MLDTFLLAAGDQRGYSFQKPLLKTERFAEQIPLQSVFLEGPSSLKTIRLNT